MTSAVQPAFNDLIHSPVRLRICGLLRRVAELEFSVVRDTLELNDANLSKNLKVLAQADLITLRKEPSPSRNDSRRLTWIGLTDAGRSALEGHLRALAMIAAE
ncbi:helix-turn-helix domain-containing protein [Pseudoclavibacter chungangensis]|uniref:Helix-turn-helix domain-containing protein n=1 Tax=Pseudoclavibacter chungangensis TaxID=587635 RepID=A0A7J5C0D9_9MICO|nr:transcriptional regulator [Pseudoclavibacter chungangensis]KAB1660184.1 helix-turn-helix domain-containing protein [Pseudoclavibacter chungangensis]